MKVQILAGVATMALAFGTATAFAQPAVASVAQYDPAGAVSQTAYSGGRQFARDQVQRLRGYDLGASVAHIGDGSSPSYVQDKHELQQEFGYDVAGGAAHIGDGSSPSYVQNRQKLHQEFGYDVAGGAAHIGDGSSPSYLRDQQELQREPGYSIGTGSAP